MNNQNHPIALEGMLERLSNIAGVSGHEAEVRRAIKPLVQDYVDDMVVDAMGNLITHKTGTGTMDLKVLVTAHMDEVGLMVIRHESDGALRVDTVGGIPDRLLPGLTVRVGEDAIPGVIGLQAIHRANRETFKRATETKKLAVDIGAKDKQEAENAAPLGTPITFATRFRPLGASWAGKAFDDRAGCAILIQLLQGERFPFDLYGAFTVQEEVGLRGARVAAYTANPDVSVSLEGTLADDLPKPEEEADTSPTTELGEGPAITVMDRSYVTPPQLLRHVLRTATEHAIPYQLKQPGISGTEAGGTHRVRGGVPSITIAVPCRYIHSPISLVAPDDVMFTHRLVDATLRALTPAALNFNA
jgi:tetrahedral aminopeptidase